MNKGEEENPGLYNISLLRNYVEYIKKHYPHLDLDEILEFAGVSR